MLFGVIVGTRCDAGGQRDWTRVRACPLICAVTTLALAFVPVQRVKAFEQVFEARCYYAERKDSPPIWAKNDCEVEFSMAQGAYRFDIALTSKRRYVVIGDYAERPQSDKAGVAYLNGQVVTMNRRNEFSCWNRGEPFLVVCIRMTLEELNQAYVERVMEGMRNK